MKEIKKELKTTTHVKCPDCHADGIVKIYYCECSDVDHAKHSKNCKRQKYFGNFKKRCKLHPKEERLLDEKDFFKSSPMN